VIVAGSSVARHLGRWSIAKSATAATLPVIPTSPNIEGDDPIDDAPEPSKEMSSGARPVGRAPLPAWLKDKPGSQAIRPSTGTADQVDPTKLCQVCGEPWAPKHVCKGAESNTDFNRPKQRVAPYQMRKIAKCDVCGKKQQRNHRCKGRPEAESPKPADKCKAWEALGRLCALHGGVWDDYDTPKGGEQVARQLPDPVPVTMPAAPVEQDIELAAIGTILKAVDGLESKQLKRVMSYVASHLEEAE
jgi:hypothetical protein